MNTSKCPRPLRLRSRTLRLTLPCYARLHHVGDCWYLAAVTGPSDKDVMRAASRRLKRTVGSWSIL